MGKSKSIVDAVNYLLQIAGTGIYSQEDLKRIVDYTSKHTNYMVLGTVFGYSVSDYAIATLKWINNEETNAMYKKLCSKLSPSRIETINSLIESRMYLEY